MMPSSATTNNLLYTSDALQDCAALLDSKNQTVAFAESCTAGLLAAAFAATAHSNVLIGGIVCYNASIKTTLLNVDPQLIEAYTAESAEVTCAITSGLASLMQADYYIGVTGLTKPGGSETREKPVGTLFICILNNNQMTEFRTCFSGNEKQILHQAIDYTCLQLINRISAKKG